MRWVIEYKNGKSISERDINFQYADKNDVKWFYFQNNQNVYGIDLERMYFFINNENFDFKIPNKEFNIIEFKTVNYNIHTNVQKVSSWNIGLESADKDDYEKYLFSISVNDEIYFKAYKKNSESKEIEQKIVRLQ